MTTTTTLPVATTRPNWTTNRVQVYHDDWRGADRILRYRSRCEGCGRRTYAFDDGENDPRGILGDHAASPMHASDYDMVGDDVACCFLCANEEPRYRRVLAVAMRRWSARV